MLDDETKRFDKTIKDGGLKHRQGVRELGLRAIHYYIDTGLCVFCDADDVTGTPHDEDCDVGECAGISEITEERRALKIKQRGIADDFFLRRLNGQ
jgi:hypothetical protein